MVTPADKKIEMFITILILCPDSIKWIILVRKAEKFSLVGYKVLFIVFSKTDILSSTLFLVCKHFSHILILIVYILQLAIKIFYKCSSQYLIINAYEITTIEIFFKG